MQQLATLQQMHQFQLALARQQQHRSSTSSHLARSHSLNLTRREYSNQPNFVNNISNAYATPKSLSPQNSEQQQKIIVPDSEPASMIKHDSIDNMNDHESIELANQAIESSAEGDIVYLSS